jgi:cellulose synthase/poly-beta-1,6-N-acetylglucosamine synthase-like glycosyltransferase
LVNGRFFDSPPFMTGQLLDSCATNNTLVARAVFDQVSEFDEQFQLSGADDLHFFRRVHRAGFKQVWCAEALVSESVTPDRANIRWLMRRSFRGGNGAVLVESALDRRVLTRVLRFLKAWLRIAQGGLGVVVSVFRGRALFAHSLRRMSLGVGMLAGLCDFTYQSHQATTGE